MRYSILIVKNKHNQFLTVKQRNELWWLPGGKTNPNQTFLQAAIRQCYEQTLIKPNIKGIININTGFYSNINALRILYYAEPQDQSAIPKLKSDQQSIQAQYFTLQQIQAMSTQWRGREIYDLPKYILDGGPIYPLSIFKENIKSGQPQV